MALSPSALPAFLTLKDSTSCYNGMVSYDLHCIASKLSSVLQLQHPCSSSGTTVLLSDKRYAFAVSCLFQNLLNGLLG